jgi:hypothetical protein
MLARARFVPALALLLLTGCGIQWQDYSCMEGSFTCRMPGKVKTETKTLNFPGGTLTMDAHGVELPNGAFMVAFMKLPRTGMPFDYTACVKAMVRTWQGELIYSKRGPMLEGVSGVEYEARIKWPKEGFATGRVFVANSRVYMLMVLGSNFRADSKEVQEFWNSFKLMKK